MMSDVMNITLLLSLLQHCWYKAFPVPVPVAVLSANFVLLQHKMHACMKCVTSFNIMIVVTHNWMVFLTFSCTCCGLPPFDAKDVSVGVTSDVRALLLFQDQKLFPLVMKKIVFITSHL